MTLLDIDQTIAALKAGRLEALHVKAIGKPGKPGYKPPGWYPLEASHINTLTRATLTASPGHLLCVWDFSQVEARFLAWAAQDHDALARFAVYDSGDHDNGDPYAAMAAKIFGGKPGDYVKGSAGEYPGRHIGKQAELGCGYGMGIPKFHQKVIDDGGNWDEIIAAMGLEIDSEQAAEIVVKAWRDLHAPIVHHWREVQDAALAVTLGWQDTAEVVGPYTWRNIEGLVLCELPSGRAICYRGMRADEEETDWGSKRYSLSYMGRRGRERTYGGKLVENLTQASCRDLMAEALIQAEAMGLQPSHTIHDEILCNVPAAEAEDAHALMGEIMTTVPKWCPGMPLAAEGLPLSFRYGK